MSITVQVPDSSINIQDMENLCKFTTCSEFSEKCSSFNYPQIHQIYSELQHRASRIKHQLEERGDYDQAWKIKANSALSIIRHKTGIAKCRLDSIRDNHISILMNDIGGSGWITGKRLVMIKCLIHMVDHYCNIGSMSVEEKSILDACRTAADLDDAPKFGGFSYDAVKNTLYNEENEEIAKITMSGYMADEIGFLLALSPAMSNLLVRAERLSDQVIDMSKCKDDDHDGLKCMKCSSEKFHDDVIDLLTEIK